jgi:inhibitor of cysteine peptidase
MRATRIIPILLVTLVLVGGAIYAVYLMTAEPARVLRLNTGEEFIITLKSNRTTGYGWQIDRPLEGDKIEQKGLRYTPYDTGLAGSGGEEEWTFKAVRPGRSKIYFKYVRPWEKDKPPAEQKTFNVEIK